MATWKLVSVACLLFGLVLTAVGAGVTAQAVIITESQASDLATTKWGSNEELKNALLDQSHKAKWGLIVIVLGTVLQILGTVIPLVRGE
jgi:hypothetical protein